MSDETNQASTRWYYIYNPSQKKIHAHPVISYRAFSCYTLQIMYMKGSHKEYAYGWDEPGQPYRASRHLSTWLEERDDAKAVDILCKARLDKVAEQSAKAITRLANLQAERDILEERKVEVIEHGRS